MSATPTDFRRALPFILKFIATLLNSAFHPTANQNFKHTTAEIVPVVFRIPGQKGLWEAQ
jgi:hypothetical protein